ncbi:MAG: hypothetical protein LRY73_05030 [Bacillus sp. (in: Bacteria)]|nr:hypothetical protein [Bacillus sp. (in: firmicutes)]
MSRRICYNAILAEEETEDPAGTRRLKRCPRKASSCSINQQQRLTELINKRVLGDFSGSPFACFFRVTPFQEFVSYWIS